MFTQRARDQTLVLVNLLSAIDRHIAPSFNVLLSRIGQTHQAGHQSRQFLSGFGSSSLSSLRFASVPDRPRAAMAFACRSCSITANIFASSASSSGIVMIFDKVMACGKLSRHPNILLLAPLSGLDRHLLLQTGQGIQQGRVNFIVLDDFGVLAGTNDTLFAHA